MNRYANAVLAGLLYLCSAAVSGSGLDEVNGEADRIHSNGKTALMVAAKHADRARVAELIRRGAEVNLPNSNGGTPIMYAALSGDVRTVLLLLRHDADAGAPAKNGWTALMIAAAKGYVDVARVLLNHGAEPNQADVYSWTPLMRAAYENRPRIVELLLANASTRIDHRGENGVTALHLAVAQSNADIVKQLLAAGADPGIRDHSGRTALDFARQNKNLYLQRLIKTRL